MIDVTRAVLGFHPVEDRGGTYPRPGFVGPDEWSTVRAIGRTGIQSRGWAPTIVRTPFPGRNPSLLKYRDSQPGGMYDRVLVPTDGSRGITETLRHGIDLAERHGATVHALYVADRRQFLGAPDDVRDEVRDQLIGEGEAAIAEVEEAAADAGLDVVSEVREGIPYQDIIDYVDDRGIDVVVIGTHGRTGRDRLTNLGSVTERVVKHVAVPVLVVNIGESA